MVGQSSERLGPLGATEIMLEDGRRFEVSAPRRPGTLRTPSEVVLGETGSFVLGTGAELVVVRPLPF